MHKPSLSVYSRLGVDQQTNGRMREVSDSSSKRRWLNQLKPDLNADSIGRDCW